LVVLIFSKDTEEVLDNYFDTIYNIENYDIEKICFGTEMDAFIAQNSVTVMTKEYLSEEQNQSALGGESQVQILGDVIRNGYTFSFESVEYSYYTDTNKRDLRNLNYDVTVIFIDEEGLEQELNVKGYIQLKLVESKWVIGLEYFLLFPREEIGLEAATQNSDYINKEEIDQDIIKSERHYRKSYLRNILESFT